MSVHLRNAALAALLTVGAAPAIAQERPFFCEMEPAQAHKSNDCLRYYIECGGGPGNSGFVSPLFENLPAEDLMNIGLEAAAAMAARNCRVFSYQEAAAALQIHRARLPK